MLVTRAVWHRDEGPPKKACRNRQTSESRPAISPLLKAAQTDQSARVITPKPDKPELDGLRREGATPTQTVDTYLNL